MLAIFGVSFLTPLDALFVLAAAAPLAALFLAERRAGRIRRFFAVRGPGRRTLVPAAIALALLPALVAVAAAQPVLVHQKLVSERDDAEGFVVFDTSTSMQASQRSGGPTRLVRAKRLAIALQARLPDVPFGLVSMTDRSLPNLMPTTDSALFDRTVDQSIAIDQPPPSQEYPGRRATTFAALAPLVSSSIFSRNAQRRLLVVLTDGEAAPTPPELELTLHGRVRFLFVHVWRAGERIYNARGRADPGYVSDPTSAAALDALAQIADAEHPFDERDLGGIVRAARDVVGRGTPHPHVDAYARVALAPWFVLAGVVPLGFLLWRRNL